eukprot:SAG31_NODE_12979_length_902_cov_1.061021_1_plen_244_part_10
MGTDHELRVADRGSRHSRCLYRLLLSALQLPSVSGALTTALSCRAGHRLGGGDMHVANLTATAAIAWCQANPKCAGFAASVKCLDTGVFEAHFQDSWGAHRLRADKKWSSWTAAPPPSPPSPTPAPPALQQLQVDLGAPRVPFVHTWKRSFGSGHAKLTRRADWRQQLALAHRELGLRGVRFHGTYDDDMGPVVTPANRRGGGSDDAQRWAFNFTALDSMWDFLTSLDVTPIVELSFMPCYLAN